MLGMVRIEGETVVEIRAMRESVFGALSEALLEVWVGGGGRRANPGGAGG